MQVCILFGLWTTTLVSGCTDKHFSNTKRFYFFCWPLKMHNYKFFPVYSYINSLYRKYHYVLWQKIATYHINFLLLSKKKKKELVTQGLFRRRVIPSQRELVINKPILEKLLTTISLWKNFWPQESHYLYFDDRQSPWGRGERHLRQFILTRTIREAVAKNIEEKKLTDRIHEKEGA